ncbi:hypothetical protein TNCV_3242891 [Trichonephila clavipes]|nr:hypothetical protein TNCV_3242891 [Trichonephila clavipes]
MKTPELEPFIPTLSQRQLSDLVQTILRTSTSSTWWLFNGTKIRTNGLNITSLTSNSQPRSLESADAQTGSNTGKGEPVGKACLERILSPRPVSREWDNRTQETREEPCPGSRELERRARGGENLRKALKKRGPEIEVERKERRGTLRWSRE